MGRRARESWCSGRRRSRATSRPAGPWRDDIAGGTGPSACPRCGHAYDPRDASTFSLSPAYSRLRFWLPGFCIAVICGVVSYATLLLAFRNQGLALFFAVPVSVGLILGYATNARILTLATLCLAAILTGVAGLVSLQLSGLFCGMIGVVVFAIPALLGVLLGLVLRTSLKLSAWSQRFYLPPRGYRRPPLRCGGRRGVLPVPRRDRDGPDKGGL